MFFGVENLNGAGLECILPTFIDIAECLRIAVDEREAGTLHLHHQSVTRHEGMSHIRQSEFHVGRHSRREWLWLVRMELVIFHVS